MQPEESLFARPRSMPARVRRWANLLVVAIPEDVAREQGILEDDIVEVRLRKRRPGTL